MSNKEMRMRLNRNRKTLYSSITSHQDSLSFQKPESQNLGNFEVFGSSQHHSTNRLGMHHLHMHPNAPRKPNLGLNEGLRLTPSQEFFSKNFDPNGSSSARESSSIMYKTSEPVRIKSIKINVAQQKIQMELSNGKKKTKRMARRGSRPQQLELVEGNEVDMSLKSSSTFSKQFESKRRFLGGRGERGFKEDTRRGKMGGKHASHTPRHGKGRKGSKNKRRGSRPGSDNKGTGGANGANSISRKEVIEILKLHKDLQKKIKFLEKEFR